MTKNIQAGCHDCNTCGHDSDCAVHNGPALPAGPCDCGMESAGLVPRKHITFYMDGSHILETEPHYDAYRANDPGWFGTVIIDGESVSVGVSEQLAEAAKPVAGMARSFDPKDNGWDPCTLQEALKGIAEEPDQYRLLYAGPQIAPQVDGGDPVLRMKLPPTVGWQVHVIGPDDIYHFESYEDAVREARGINKISAKFDADHPGDEVLCLAYVRPTFGADSAMKEPG